MAGDLVSDAVDALCARHARADTSRRVEASPSPGIYAWWSRSPSLLGIAGTQHGDAYLYYVGITTSQGGVRGRLRQHLSGPLASSTLRRALVALGATGAQPLRTAAGKLALTKDDELALTVWMANTFEISWYPTDTPRLIEAGVIAQLRPPLNVHHNASHEAFATVTGARRAMSSESALRTGE